MEFGLQLPDTLTTALGGRGHDRQLGGQVLMLEAAVGRQECVDLAKRIEQDVRITVTASDQASEGVAPTD